MRASLLLVVSVGLCWCGVASAQAPAGPSAPTINRGGGVAGTALGTGSGAAGVQGNEGERGLAEGARRRARARSPVVIQGIGHIGAGTSGLGAGLGNAVGGIGDTAIGAGSGGMLDTTSFGSSVGGVSGLARGLGAGAGGIRDRIEIGINTGGIQGSPIGAGTGGMRDLNSFGASTGGIREDNATRFRVGQ
jgi:hypothetical protein